MRKISFVLVLCLALLMCNISIFAVKNDIRDASGKDVVADPDIKATKQFLVTFTRPAGNETTSKKSYTICGYSEEENLTDIQVVLSIYNDDTDKYEELNTSDDKSRWDIGKFGVFTKEIQLPNKGANKLKFVVYKKTENGKLKLGTSLQVNYFTITVLEENNILKKSWLKITDIINDMFSK